MSRLDRLLKHADTSQRGIEVAPYFRPVLPKRDGHDVLILDVFDTDHLRALGAKDPGVPKERVWEIEEVDLVGDASRIGDVVAQQGLTGQMHYIISSHNFEHLPNPILFLQGAYDSLAPGGVLSMAVPDYRACFDHFRLPSRLSDWLQAYHEDRRQPSAETVFDAQANMAMFERNGQELTACDFATDTPDDFMPNRILPAAYAGYQKRKAEGGDYFDTHCNLFFPDYLTLLLHDLRGLGLIQFDVIEISRTYGHEFFVHLRKGDGAPLPVDDAFYETREALLRKVSKNLGGAPFQRTAWLRKLTARLNTLRIRIKNALSK